MEKREAQKILSDNSLRSEGSFQGIPTNTPSSTSTSTSTPTATATSTPTNTSSAITGPGNVLSITHLDGNLIVGNDVVYQNFSVSGNCYLGGGVVTLYGATSSQGSSAFPQSNCGSNARFNIVVTSNLSGWKYINLTQTVSGQIKNSSAIAINILQGTSPNNPTYSPTPTSTPSPTGSTSTGGNTGASGNGGTGRPNPNCTYNPSASSSYSANNCIPTVTTPFLFGANTGWYGNHLTDDDVGKLVTDMGFQTFRPNMNEAFMHDHGDTIRLPTFQHYVNQSGDIKAKDLVLFVSAGWDPYQQVYCVDSNTGQPKECYPTRDGAVQYNGCPAPSGSFKGIYEPIWSGNIVNSQNKFANFINRVVNVYGPSIKYLEIMNEPDLPAASETLGFRFDYGGNPTSDNWFNRAPTPCELRNSFAPAHHYIRMLRIAYEIVRKYNRDNPTKTILVTTGGIGLPGFLNYILRNTDNPSGGSVTADYPLKGGAYFDVLSFHHYPFFWWWKTDSVKGYPAPAGGQAVADRHSDGYASRVIELYHMLDNELVSFGYNGATFPKKYFMMTELGVPDMPWQMDPSKLVDGGVQWQQNILTKSIFKTMKSGFLQTHIYKTGSHVDPGTTLFPGIWGENEGGLWASFGLYNNLKTHTYSQAQLTELGKTMMTMSTQLRNFDYDPIATAALNLPSTIDGGAFKLGNKYRYMLWAKTNQSGIESVTVSYTFNNAVATPNSTMRKYNLNTSVPNSYTEFSSSSAVQLTSNPSIIYQP